MTCQAVRQRRIGAWIAGAVLMTLVAGSVFAQCQPSLQGDFDDGVAPTSGINFVTLDLDIQSFPEALAGQVSTAVDRAALKWNDACQGQPSNRFPALIPFSESLGLTQSDNTLVFYGRQRDPVPRRCNEDDDESPLCYPYAENRFNTSTGNYQIEVFQEGGVEGDLKPTLTLFSGRLEDLFAHEFGHIFGFAESPCPGSVMHQDTALTIGGQVTAEDCAFMESTHKPRHPLESLGEDPNGLERACVLASYCDQAGDPWAVIRNECGWITRTVSDVIEVALLLPGGVVEFTLVIGRGVPEFTCANWNPPGPPPQGGFPLPPPIDFTFLEGPAVAIGLPRDEEVVTDSLYLRGWASSWLFGVGDLAVWIDGRLVDPSALRWGFYSPELCNAGVDPGICDPYSGFEATVDLEGFSPGEHWLDVAVVDQRPEGPLATHLRRRFFVSESTNHDPVALDDEATATVDLVAVAGLPVDIDVTSNDYDPDGDPIRLTNQGVVRPPSHGTVTRISDHVIRYTPNVDAPPTDSFRYAIRDTDNLQSRGDVTISVYYLFALP